jgi:hypothetical protein
VCILLINPSASVAQTSATLMHRGRLVEHARVRHTHRGLRITFSRDHLKAGRYTIRVVVRDKAGHRYISSVKVTVRRH